MAPPRALVDDAVEEILLRLPPDDPALLVRASLVCKSWRRLLTDAAFLRRYRGFHRAPPMLGLFRNTKGCVARFVPTGSFRPRDLERRNCCVVDCRHGRVLLENRIAPNYLVWDPTTGEEWEIPDDADFSYSNYSATVVCAAADCDHLDCHGGPFLVVLVGTDTDSSSDGEWFAHACVYSSEACEWSAPSTVELDYYVDLRPPFLIRDALYFICEGGIVILRYDFSGERGLSVINAQCSYDDGIALIPTEDGGLRLVGFMGYSLDLWSLEAIGPDGVAMWTQLTEIELDTLLPDDDSMDSSCMIGFAKAPDSNVIFVNTDVGVFMIGLESHSARKVCEPDGDCYEYSCIFPYMSFFTPDFGRGGLL